MIKTAVIIAGGEGSRLKPLSNRKPKAMVLVAGQPILYWILRWLKRQGIRNVVIGVAYRKSQIIRYVRANDGFGLNVKFSAHTLEGGTAQGFQLAISRHVTDAQFLAMNCDEITNMDIGRLVRTHDAAGALVTMAVAPFNCRFSVVDVKPSGRVSGFTYGRIMPDVPISIGIYIFDRRILARIPGTGSIEHAVFTPMAKAGGLVAHRLRRDELWISVNDVKNVREVEEHAVALGLQAPSRPNRTRRSTVRRASVHA